MSGDLVHDRAEIRNSADDDADRLVRRVYAALNSGRDAAVVQVVLDETDQLRREVETLREGNRVACGRFEVAEARLGRTRSMVNVLYPDDITPAGARMLHSALGES